jgi:hypothetical protein
VKLRVIWISYTVKLITSVVGPRDQIAAISHVSRPALSLQLAGIDGYLLQGCDEYVGVLGVSGDCSGTFDLLVVPSPV